MRIDGIRDTIGSGPGVVLWRYQEPGGTPGIAAGNPFAEWASSTPNIMYRRCLGIVQPPACRFPLAAFLPRLAKNKVLILHNPEVFSDLVAVLPEIGKACLGQDARLVLVSDWGDFLDRCAKALEPLSDLLPVISVGSDGQGPPARLLPRAGNAPQNAR